VTRPPEGHGLMSANRSRSAPDPRQNQRAHGGARHPAPAARHRGCCRLDERLLGPTGYRGSRRRAAPARRSERKPVRSWAPKAAYFPRSAGRAGYIAVPNISGTKPRTTISARASVTWCWPREARWSSGPPIEKPEPGAPRVLGSWIELDADLRDRVPLHVAHD